MVRRQITEEEVAKVAVALTFDRLRTELVTVLQ
jgi:hypothetical protein